MVEVVDVVVEGKKASGGRRKNTNRAPLARLPQWGQASLLYLAGKTRPGCATLAHTRD